MSGNLGPVGKFLPRKGCCGNRLMWSVIIIRSPILKSGFMPPDALLTKRVFIPSSYIMRMGNVTSFML